MISHRQTQTKTRKLWLSFAADAGRLFDMAVIFCSMMKDTSCVINKKLF